ncbi:uncharacterized protein LOC143293979 [Babylonia areolata]|uniref:uncharacterized protein LOC143293979 n=1 Tax=Babylonia areolata TaxID=304850 RepID=UPI003FD689BE
MELQGEKEHPDDPQSHKFRFWEQQHQCHHRLHKGRTHQAQGHLCQWSLGNSPMQLLQSLEKQHTERHLEQVALYLQHYSGFSSAAKTGMITTAPASNLLPMDKLTSYQWLLAVYIQDTCERLEDSQAAITSVYGAILKTDSTKIR